MSARARQLSKAKKLSLRGRSVRIWALEQAKLYVGVDESPAGSNRGPHIDRWCIWANGLVGYPWCSAFVCGMYRESVGLYVPEPRRASVGFLEAWAAKVGRVLGPGVRPRRGDLICYRFDSDSWPDHIGIVDRVVAIRWRGGEFVGRVRTVEGNTSAGNDANGGEVQIRWRDVSRVKFVRLDRSKLVHVKEVRSV